LRGPRPAKDAGALAATSKYDLYASAVTFT